MRKGRGEGGKKREVGEGKVRWKRTTTEGAAEQKKKLWRGNLWLLPRRRLNVADLTQTYIILSAPGK